MNLMKMPSYVVCKKNIDTSLLMLSLSPALFLFFSFAVDCSLARSPYLVVSLCTHYAWLNMRMYAINVRNGFQIGEMYIHSMVEPKFILKKKLPAKFFVISSNFSSKTNKYFKMEVKALYMLKYQPF